MKHFHFIQNQYDRELPVNIGSYFIELIAIKIVSVLISLE